MNENLSIPQGMDEGAVNLARAIRKQESGGDYNKYGDSGSSYGAYQWNNQPHGKSVPLQKDEIPSNFRSWASENGLDPNDFSPKNQDLVAYNKIKKWKDEGKNVIQIAALWNGGDENRYDPNYVTKSGLPSQKSGVYDVPAYVKKVNDYYQELKNKNGSQDSNNAPVVGSQDDKPGLLHSLAAGIVKPFAEVGTNLVNAGQIALGMPETQPFSGSFLGDVKGLGKVDITKAPWDPANLDTLKKSASQGAQIGSTLASVENVPGLIKNLFTSGKVLGSPVLTKVLGPTAAEEFGVASAAQKGDIIASFLKESSSPAEKQILNKALEELGPQMAKESGLTPGLLRRGVGVGKNFLKNHPLVSLLGVDGAMKFLENPIKSVWDKYFKPNLDTTGSAGGTNYPSI